MDVLTITIPPALPATMTIGTKTHNDFVYFITLIINYIIIVPININ